jgi:hypothetical protein
MKNSFPVVMLIAILIAFMILFSKIQNNSIDQQVSKLNQEIEELAENNSEEPELNNNENETIEIIPDSIPNWVFDLGFKKPKNLSFVKNKSKQTIKNPESDSYDSIELYYSGSPEEIEKAMDTIQKSLIIKLKRIEQKEKDENLIGYTNFNESNNQPNFLITIYANKDQESLLINFTNAKQMKKSIKPNLEIAPSIEQEQSVEEIDLHINDN